MGRLDDAAKRKVVELRKAGLSFRKIKAVLELENIKVSAQAVYLFLREYQGKQGRIEPENGIISPAPTQQALAGAGVSREGRHAGWSNHQLQNLLREASRHAGFAGEVAKQGQDGGHSIEALEARAPPPRAGGSSEGSSSEHQMLDKDIQIVSVTSLARNNQQRPVQSIAAGSGPGIHMRRRITPSQAANPILAARRRLLDKAMSHRAKMKDTSQQSFQQVASLLRRDQSSTPETDFRRAMREPLSFDLTKEVSTDGQPGSAGTPRRFPLQRPSMSVRSPQVPLHIGIRPPVSTQATPTSQSPGGAVNRLQSPGAPGPCRRDGNPSPQQTSQEASNRAGARGGPVVLQEQIQTLGTEVHSLGLAVRMLVEQQSKIEREQVQQTQIQRQILSTLQGLSSRLGLCNSLPQQKNKNPSPPSLPASSTSFSQDTFTYNQGTYEAQCSQSQPSYNHMDPNLETAQTLKLPGLNPSDINGFQSCSNTDSLPFVQAQSFAPVYPQQLSQTHLSSFSQSSFAPTYTLSHPQTYGGAVSRPPDYSNSSRVGGVQECSRPTVNSDCSTQDPQLNIIKVENI